MPLEGHWDRLATPLSGRERRLLVILAAVVVAVAIAVGVYAATDRARHQAGCIDVTVPASVGGATIHRCGKDAVTFCRTQGSSDAAISRACKREGLATG
ncbi:MAG TPA: hypothetical protein VLV28_05665 [Gaiellaceae bacterium]|nr:hypothetical protein [Gaiellaceae bacterium]